MASQTPRNPAGMAEALRRIAEEAERRTGVLDLSGLGLEELPDELFELTHLRKLDLRRDRLWEREKRYKIDSRQDDLARLSCLTFLSVAGSDLTSLGFLKGLRELETLDCSDTCVADLLPLAGLGKLQELRCWNTNVTDLSPLTGIGTLETLNCSLTRVSDLRPIAGLTNLRIFNFTSSQVADLSPLSDLIKIHTFCCENSSVSDLSPLASLTGIQTLLCSGTHISEISAIRGLVNLQRLDCSYTDVACLSPLEELTDIRELNCAHTNISDLSHLSRLINLEELDISNTNVMEISSLRHLSALEVINLSDTAVVDISPLSGLDNIRKLYCSDTNIHDLSSIAHLANIRELDLCGCELHSIPLGILELPMLDSLFLWEVVLPGLPPGGVLSSNNDDNCLDRVRAHFADLAAESETLLRVKLLLIGNGGAGKTQIARRLSGQDFDENWNSTHGIEVGRTVLSGEPEVQLHIWDFGGQDIYHGAHALFLTGPAIIAAVWDKKTEAEKFQNCGGLEFQNRPLPYWIKVAQHQGHAHSPHLVIQNKCDRAEDEVRRFPIPDDLLDASPYAATLRVSAKTGRGFAALTETLTDAAVWLRAPERMGLPTVGAGRLRVQRRLEATRDAERDLPSDQRRHRLLSLEAFTTICSEEGGVSSPEHLLTWLDAEGSVIYRPRLLPDRIVLDQNWALAAIYAVFERTNGTYAAILGRGGRFDRSLLALRLWKEHAEADQRLFIALMRSCGICFLHRKFDDDDDAFTEYIAPDLLPDRASVADRLGGLWDEDAPTEQAVFRHPLLHSGLIRSIMAELGERAGPNAIYWRGGVWGFERNSGSRLMIEAIETGPWCGEIRVRTQRGRAAELSDQLVTLVEHTQNRLGLRPDAVERTSRAPMREDARPLTLGQEAPKAEEWYVSYAWGDESPEGREREKVVDRLCAAAEARGLVIQRDKNVLGFGDDIYNFMRRIGGGRRVFVILSEKYLRSPFCMYELSEIWRTSLREVDFFNRVRVFALPGTEVWKAKDWLAWAKHWETEYNELDTAAHSIDLASIGEYAFEQLRLMRVFQAETARILGALAHIVQPRTFEELERYGFDDPA